MPDTPEAVPFYGCAFPFFLSAVERKGVPPLDDGAGPALLMRFTFHRPNEPELPFFIEFLMDPEGAVEEFLADDSHVDQIFAHFSPDSPAETTPEESING
jgi:hypothetical protein